MRQYVTRQNVTRQNVTRQNVTRQNVTWQNVAEPFLRLLDTNGQKTIKESI